VSPVTCQAFTLVEVMVSTGLLSLIVLVLMAVFNSTQTAFRAGLTQTDVLESGRSAMGLIAGDLERMTPSLGTNYGAVNFCVTTNYHNYPALHQSLIGVSDPKTTWRTNVLENFFILSRENTTWQGTGYAVVTDSPDGLGSLYRYTTNHPVMAVDPARIFYSDFTNFFLAPTNGSHLMNGVVDLRVHAFDTNGLWICLGRKNISTNALVFSGEIVPGEVGCFFYSNALPASVEVEMGVLEDRTLQRAESLGDPLVRSNYFAGHAGQVHVFRQRVSVRNLDPSAYQ
jgi:hypothetical protein